MSQVFCELVIIFCLQIWLKYCRKIVCESGPWVLASSILTFLLHQSWSRIFADRRQFFYYPTVHSITWRTASDRQTVNNNSRFYLKLSANHSVSNMHSPPQNPASWCGTVSLVESRDIAFGCLSVLRTPCPAPYVAGHRSAHATQEISSRL